ncbi:plasmid pRiA4b ORF-3 family protein [Luteolibacter sp. AS25]|uniref:plasmid pRiA4b ORF-3 family protein n=1 Tax=Luteolibacter sp. AS25 TaxID=3135776 RepID=UPI00398A8063
MAKKSAAERVVVKVFTYGIQPKISRTFSISTSVTFLELSDAIQAAMGWDNKHPHEFRHGKGKRLVDVIGPVGLADQTLGEFQDETALTVSNYMGRKRLPLRMLYRYDFADEWIHEVVFDKRMEGEGGPEMISGERACPPEDFGGAFQYMQALAGEIEWAHPGYDPEVFDIKAVDFTKKATRKRK